MPRAAPLALALALTALAAPLGCRGDRLDARPAAKVTLRPCLLAHPSLPGRLEAACTRIEVPEDWARPSGPRIALAVSVIHATGRHPSPDPVFFLAGGPGQAARSEFVALAPAFARVQLERDVVLVDQRGTGESSPLACPESPLDPLAASSADERERVAACARTLGDRVALYGTDAFVRDLDRVREALGYERINLVGVSYGTRAAMVYARTFPQRTRSLVLDAVAPPDLPVGGFFARDAQRAFDALAARCAEDSACRARFPDPRADLRAVLAALEARPAALQVPDPLRGRPEPVRFSADLARGAVFLLSYAPETAALLPLLLAQARRGELVPLAAQALLSGGDVAAGVSRPVNLSVLCGEDVPFHPPGGAGDGTYLGAHLTDTYRELCAVWPHRTVDAAWKAPFASAVPALLLSGDADPVTPPEWGARALATLPNGRHLVLRGQGHGALVRGCVPLLVDRFLETGDARGLDAACLDRVRPTPIFLDPAGPAP